MSPEQCRHHGSLNRPCKHQVIRSNKSRYFDTALRDKSRSTALDLISANPGLKGFLAFGSQGPIGSGRAIEERRKVGEIFVLGPFSPGQGQKLVKSDAISGGFLWNPKQAGEVFVTQADHLMKGNEVIP